MSDELPATQIDRDHWFKMWETARAELAAAREDFTAVRRDWEAFTFENKRLRAERDALRAELAAERESLHHERVSTAKAEVERDALRVLLRPFAEAADNFDGFPVKNAEEWFVYGGTTGVEGNVGAVTVGDLRRARAVYEKIKGRRG